MSQDSFGNSDLCKAMYKNALDLSLKLAELYRQTKVYSDVTSPQAIMLRGQLKDLCLRIMLESPCEYGSRAEDFAWRKVFYEPIQLLKKFQRRTQLQCDLGLTTAIKIQVLSALGFYQNLLIALQSRYSLDMRNIIDIPVTRHNFHPQHFSPVVDKETRDAAIDLVYRSLVCMGNLARYQCDYLDDWTKALPTRYYLQALMLKPDSGLPHNQLALLAGSRIVEGAYHWLLCLASKEPFMPAKRNLLDILGRVYKRVSTQRRTSASSMKIICSQLVAVVYQFINLSDTHRQVTDQNIDALRSLGEFALGNFSLYLKKMTHINDYHLKQDQQSHPNRRSACHSPMPADLLFKLVIVYQALVYLLEKQSDKSLSRQSNAALFGLCVKISLSLFENVLRFMRDRIAYRIGLEQFETVRTASKMKNNKQPKQSTEKSLVASGELKKPRRRSNRLPMWNEFESDDGDMSTNENDLINAIREEKNEENYCGKENDHAFVGSLENGADDDDTDGFSFSSGESSDAVTGYESSGEDKSSEASKLSPFEAFYNETWTPVLKILCDWISSNRLLLSSFKSQDDGASTSFWQAYCDLVNILPPQGSLVHMNLALRSEIQQHLFEAPVRMGDKWTQHFALPEDRAIGRFPALGKSHAGIEMAPLNGLSHILHSNELIAIRIAVIFYHSRSFTAEFLDYLPATSRYMVRNRHGQAVASVHLEFHDDVDATETRFLNPEDDDDDEDIEKLRPKSQSTDEERDRMSAGAVNSSNDHKQKQMRAMAELWLKSEISRLEKPSSPSSQSVQIPIYACLVSDLFLSIQGIKHVKTLLQSQRLIVAMPQAIITHLDFEKVRSEASREASRFIESELRKGTPYLRIYNQSGTVAKMSDSRDFFSEYRTLPAVFAVVRQLLSENINAPSISRCLVAIVSSSALNELPHEVETYVKEELSRLPNAGACVQFKSARALIDDLNKAAQLQD